MSILFFILALTGIYVLGERFDGRSYPEIAHDLQQWWYSLFKDLGEALTPVAKAILYFVFAPYFGLVRGESARCYNSPLAYTLGSFCWMIGTTLIVALTGIALVFVDLYWLGAF